MLLKGSIQTPLPRIELIPLIDVLFLLLIFFFYSIFHLVEEKGIPVNLAPARTSLSQRDTSLLVVINERGEFFLGKDPVSLEAIAAKFTTLKKEDRVLIRSDSNAPVGPSIKILDRARRAGLQQIAIQTATNTGD